MVSDEELTLAEQILEQDAEQLIAQVERHSIYGDLSRRYHDLDYLDVEKIIYELKAQEKLLETHLKKRQQIAIKAPFDGIVRQIHRGEGSALHLRDEMITLERNTENYVEAFVNQEEVVQLGLNDAATVFVPALDITVKAEITKIDRTSGFVDEQESNYTWRGSKDRSARVFLTVTDPDYADQWHKFPTGLPTVILFERRSIDTMKALMRDQLGIQTPAPFLDSLQEDQQ